ncbi:non-heme iron oxygenase ferredoxin subunit [Xylella fastidiosa]|uniref:Non-heme iron oxygenase ferredoxin subunit n=2 Tax=Xylella fastidiosa TaxID=2371 RepID=A0A9Q4QTE5_XYLFS|nr:non-heme iron oxygenase ferredoxin subunit [Xylella fastidiosa]ERI60974.1 benzene 1,2-dioxygenase ferredoxin [Xylella fastidiosa subsp. multiplex Griffin-1]ACA11802.1 benzene 1,2-dioxygenase, ferredoxin protein [Xylella fastidiosa M12]AIC09787.1 benzene 1,2-dioxygenase ferredoxin [Xylella fastidiosa subsp. sandyi Ann-1]KAJ4852928.1 non-heme iron oxygenase ferredoxin subunit [Xylella fastidiosa subsp. multiplex]KFA41089.1 benzene 1,2-dioxygenase, ferredoxin protein [Xylella fastidiosa]
MNDTWTFVCTDTELLPGEMKTVCDDITGTPIVVFNIDGELYALEDRCSHEDYPLSPGHFDPTTGSIECPLHSACFNIRNGQPLCAPAYTPVMQFPVKREQTTIWTRDNR